MRNIWLDFWYEWHYPEHIRYGGGPQGHRVFRKQRLINLLIILVLSIEIFYFYFKK